MRYRFDVGVRPEFSDPAADGVLGQIGVAHPEIRKKIQSARVFETAWLELDASVPEAAVKLAAREVLFDPVLSLWLTLEEPALACDPRAIGIQKHFRPGVTDNVGATLREAFGIVLGDRYKNAVQSGRFASGLLLVLMPVSTLSDAEVNSVIKDVFSNAFIEATTRLSHAELREGGRFQDAEIAKDWVAVDLHRSNADALKSVERIRLQGLSDGDLERLSKNRLWALSLEEMHAIRNHFEALKRDPTDVEMEVLAQTWSEHCKHKIFNAEIDYTEAAPTPGTGPIPARVQSLFKTTIAGVTSELPRPWLLSVFSDNAGLVALDDEDAVCIKVETHNSPSALDPYGGALTGIVGVNRDIMGCGLGARPIFNTDVFCVASTEEFAASGRALPPGLLHPFRVLDGVRRGVEHGGNKSGIPTVNGALVFDERFLGKPLVYCGTGGILPRKILNRPAEEKILKPGDKICMVGGRIGKDGIHGATFSSLAMDETSPASAVQLGDPMTQKRVMDFLMEARDRGLYRTLTDNGAGGLSSSVGELSQISNGARMDVSLAKTKYPGLTPYELTVSESQERMTLAVAPEQLPELLDLAARRNVEVSALGEFTNSGVFEILYAGQTVGALDLNFLHKGVPRMKLKGRWTPPAKGTSPTTSDVHAELLRQLNSPNIASKEWLIRQYDHEVQAQSVVKPLQSANVGTDREAASPNDAGVVKPKPNSWVGVAVGCGLWPKLSDVDPWVMAQMSVDEAIRNILAPGAEFGTPECVVSLIDNFCWPDPVGDEQKTAALVRACFGMREACLELGVPLISGKDSMKNDYKGPGGVKISVPPTLLMTAMGRVRDVRAVTTSEVKQAGDALYLLGRVSERADWKFARNLYAWLGGTRGKQRSLLRSVHDVSEGGWLVAVAETLFARGLGAQLGNLDIPPFQEGFHSFIVSCEAKAAAELEREWSELGIGFSRLGQVTDTSTLEWGSTHWPVSELRQAWNCEGAYARRDWK